MSATRVCIDPDNVYKLGYDRATGRQSPPGSRTTTPPCAMPGMEPAGGKLKNKGGEMPEGKGISWAALNKSSGGV